MRLAGGFTQVRFENFKIAASRYGVSVASIYI